MAFLFWRKKTINKVLEEAWKNPAYLINYLTSKSGYLRDDFYNVFTTTSGFKAPALGGNGVVKGMPPENAQQFKAVVQLLHKEGTVTKSEWQEAVFRNLADPPKLDNKELNDLRIQRGSFKSSWIKKQRLRIEALWDIGKAACEAHINEPTDEEIARHIFKFKPAHERE